jgi:hypothetical protein
MAELDPKAAELLIRVFLGAYNQLHGTHYDRFDSGGAGADADFLCHSSIEKLPLKVQHTRAWGDPEKEWAHPAEVANLVRRQILKRLRAKNVADRHISLTVDRLPDGRREKLRFVEDLWNAIELNLDHPVPGGPLRRAVLFNRSDWEQFYVPIKESVQELEIIREEPPRGKPATVGWSSKGVSTEGVVDAVARVVAAVDQKEKRYQGTGQDLILVVDSEVMPYFEDEVQQMQAALKAGAHRFKEIWVTSLWIPPSAHRVWPS